MASKEWASEQKDVEAVASYRQSLYQLRRQRGLNWNGWGGETAWQAQPWGATPDAGAGEEIPGGKGGKGRKGKGKDKGKGKQDEANGGG